MMAAVERPHLGPEDIWLVEYLETYLGALVPEDVPDDPLERFLWVVAAIDAWAGSHG